MKHYNIPIFIPELACPNRCIYCNQRSISGQLIFPENNEIIKKIQDHINSFTPPYEAEIAFFGGNFTGIDIEKQIELLELVQPYIKDRIKGIRISTRPDYINSKILSILKAYNVITIEIGAQSFSQDVLDYSKRGHTVKDIIEASKQIKEFGFELGLQMMIGLPLDTIEKSIHTAKSILALGAKSTRIYPCLVIENTELAEIFLSGQYKPLDLENAIIWTSKIYEIFHNKIDILRVGLHPSESFINNIGYLAGSFHVSFRELVLTNIWKKKLMKINQDNSKKLVITTSNISRNYAIGYNSQNKNLLKQRFKCVEYKTKPNLKDFDLEFQLEKCI